MRTKASTARKLQIIDEILAYLIKHRDAQDTLEGIVDWWLSKHQINYQRNQVKKALAELVAQGLVLEHKRTDARIHYRLNQHRIEEIRALLKGKI